MVNESLSGASKAYILSEAEVRLSRPDYCRSRDEGHPFPVVTLQTRRRNYKVPEKNLIKQSHKYQRVINAGGRIPVSIDLTDYDVTSVRAFVDAVCNIHPRNLRLEACNLNDFITLVVIFEIDKLLIPVMNCLREQLSSGTLCSLVSTLCLTAQHWALASIPEWRVSLLKLTINEFEKIRLSHYYGKMPISVMTQVLSSCDLIAPELSIAEWAIDWCSAVEGVPVHTRVLYIDRLFICVRSSKLNTKDKDTIRSRLHRMFTDKEQIDKCMDRLRESRMHRCCVIKSHIEEKRIRCGIPDHPAYIPIRSVDLTVTFGEDVHTAEDSSDREKDDTLHRLFHRKMGFTEKDGESSEEQSTHKPCIPTNGYKKMN